MIIWPSSLPQKVDADKYKEAIQDNRLRSDPDMGPPKMRPRFSAVIETFSIEMNLTRDQSDDFITFYKSTTSFGTKEFQWTHPRTEATVMMRFAEPYSLVRVYHYVKVAFTLEVLP
jgi:hypothetical protein